MVEKKQLAMRIKLLKTVDNYDLYDVSVWIDKNKNREE